MAITDKEQGVWLLDEVYNKQNEGDIWVYNATEPLSLYAMGENGPGCLGLNNTTAVPGYTQLPGVWMSIGYGGESAQGGVKQGNTLWTWGTGSYGALGHNEEAAYSSPKQVGSSADWKQSAQSRENMGAVKTDGTLWMWGKNPYGQLGLNTGSNNAQRSSPTQVGTDTNWDELIGGIGYDFMGKKTDGTLWTWGRNLNGSMGQNQSSSGGLLGFSSPVQIPGTTWGKVVCGSNTNFALKTDGTLWGWGQNYRGALGLNYHPGSPGSIGSQSSPTQVGTDTTWSDLAAGLYNCLAVKTDGTLWSWGYANGNVLGLNQPESDQKSSPTQVGTDTTWRSIYTNHSSAFGTKTDGTMWSWGYNGRSGAGILGLSTFAKLSSPTQVPGASWYTVQGGGMFYTFGSKSP